MIFLSEINYYSLNFFFKSNFMSSSISSSRICFLSGKKVLFWSMSVRNTWDTSESFVLQLAAVLCFAQEMYPQSVLKQNEALNQKESWFNKTKLKPVQQYYEIWCDYLFSLVAKDQIVTVQNQVVLISEVSEKYFQIVKKQGYVGQYELKQGREIKEFIVTELYGCKWKQIPQKQIRRIAIINMSRSVLEPDKNKPKIHLLGLYSGIFYRRGDLWTSFNLLSGNIPSSQQLITFDAIILSGSAHSVNNLPKPFQLFESNCLQALKMSKKLKVLGICFGHQMIAHALGVKVQRLNFIKGLEYVQMKDVNLDKISYFSDLKIRRFKLYTFHGEYVLGVPKGYINIGQSMGSDHEMFVSDDYRVLTLQAHPEFSKEYVQLLDKRIARYYNEKIFDQNHVIIDSQHHETLRILRGALRRFIDWQIHV